MLIPIKAAVDLEPDLDSVYIPIDVKASFDEFRIIPNKNSLNYRREKGRLQNIVALKC